MPSLGKVSLFLFLGLWLSQRCQKVFALFPRGKEQPTLQDSTFAPQHQFVEEVCHQISTLSCSAH